VLREILAEELARIDDERLEHVHITAVDVDNDLNRAIVFYDSLSGESGDADVLEALGARRVRLQAAIGRQMHARKTPILEFRPDEVLSHFLDATWWYLTDEEIELGPEIATQVMIDMSDPRSEHFGQMRHETLPADHIFGRRVEMLTLAVLGQLRAKANWHRIAREWIYGDPPVTELGRQESAFYS